MTEIIEKASRYTWSRGHKTYASAINSINDDMAESLIDHCDKPEIKRYETKSGKFRFKVVLLDLNVNSSLKAETIIIN